YFILQARYIGAGSHLWALAVEQQYYLLWPLVVLALPRARLGIAVAAMIVLGMLSHAMAGFAGWPSVTFDVLTTSAFESMGCGAMLSLFMQSGEQTPLRGARWISMIGCAGIAL